MYTKFFFFNLKFEHIFEKKGYVFVIFSWSILFGKTPETRNSPWCFH